MMDEYLGMIKIFCGDYPPKDWMFCHGQIINVSDKPDLFKVLGSYYGGNGSTNFALPNLQAQIPVGFGKRDGLTGYKLGETGGVPFVSLEKKHIPAHKHTFSVNKVATTVTVPVTNSAIGIPSAPAGRSRADTKGFNNVEPDTRLKASSATTVTGSGQGHINLQPYLGVHYIICVRGIFPPHP